MDVQISDSSTAAYSGAGSTIGLIQPQVQQAPDPALASVTHATAPDVAFPAVGTAGSTATGGTSAKVPAPVHVDSSFGDTAAKLFHAARPLSVEFHTTNHPNEIVTILRDPTTGQVYAEFPPDAVVRLAEFFQHLAGFVVDQKA
jgi:hypothetical protein